MITDLAWANNHLFLLAFCLSYAFVRQVLQKDAEPDDNQSGNDCIFAAKYRYHAP